jgi:hypothetical protein
MIHFFGRLIECCRVYVLDLHVYWVGNLLSSFMTASFIAWLNGWLIDSMTLVFSHVVTTLCFDCDLEVVILRPQLTSPHLNSQLGA